MTNTTIPKIIHYCWFGNGPKNKVIQNCIESWKKTCPDFVIKEWNESNYDVQANPFTKRMHLQRRFAFVADYARLEILEKEGGFYLDTDMLLLQSLSFFINNECVLGEEEAGVISAGMLGATPDHAFIKAAKKYYDTSKETLVTIPIALTEVYKNYNDKESIYVCPPHYFYPFSQATIASYHGQDLGKDVYGVHMWNYSWGHPLNKFFKKIGIYYLGKRLVELLGIKKILKRLLGFI